MTTSLHPDQPAVVKLHRCPLMFLRTDLHPCWKVQKALDEHGIAYEVVRGPLLRRRRTALEWLTRQRLYPVIEFEDGKAYRAESDAMVSRIRSGTLLSGVRQHLIPS